MHATTRSALQLLILVLTPLHGVAQIQLWSQTEPIDATVISANEDALTIQQPGRSTPTSVAWDRVRKVGDANTPSERTRTLARTAWRARTRLERDDWRAAEPLFESLFETFDAAAGPTAATVAEGLLRCRLRRGAQASAVFPWLAHRRIINQQPPGQSWLGGHIDLPPVIDPSTGLAPGLPPIWAADQALAGLTDAPDWELIPQDDPVARDLATLYHAAARFEHQPETTAPAPRTDHPGVRLVHDIVQARIGTPDERETARESLDARLDADDDAPWIEVWCRAGIGRSLLLEDDPIQNRRGIVHLLHIPARFGASHPYLAGLALAESAAALDRLGDTDAAQTLHAELIARFPKHPARRTLGRPAAAAPIDAPTHRINA